ncbi:interleukin-1 beta [Sorex araneus]|uniref:interleukin-1 beta n=1 Tax=Sorex araneus TaxID=42254 RepID=UPI00243350CC|nr:interleukin-1 beta [Sorex araneus]
MAAVPELSCEVAYHSHSDNDLFFEPEDRPQQLKCCSEDLDPSHWKDSSLQLQFSHQRYNKKLRHVVSVIVAVERLKSFLVPDSVAFQDDDLRSIFSMIFEEEPIECEQDDYLCDAALQFRQCKIRDIEQKCLVLSPAFQLYALHLTTESLNKQAVFYISLVEGKYHEHKTPVALGLKDKNMYLSCAKIDGTPTLQLERVDPNNYPKWKMETRFIFNKTEVNDKVEFESALFPNWYISTSQEEQMPVFLTNTKGGQDITDFSMESLSP